ncbi:hypothetical protein C8R45DRAFT_764261, partial [Mycena sanguinolenta]
ISRKRPVDPPTTGDTSSKKRARANPNDALFSVSQALNTFGENMKAATRELTEVLRTSNTNSSPERRGRALELARKETWLGLTDRIRFGGIVWQGEMADEYISWAREGSPERKSWVCAQLG